MKKTTRLLSVFLFTLLLFGLLLSRSAYADSSIYLTRIVIQSDGLVVPETDYIHKVGNVYTLTRDLVGLNSITISCSNIVFDGAGYSIDGSINYLPSEYLNSAKYFRHSGLFLWSVTNVTVKNVAVINFQNPNQMEMNNCHNCSLFNVDTNLALINGGDNSISNTSQSIRIENSTYNFLNQCNVDLSIDEKSPHNTVTENIVLLSCSSKSNLFYKNNIDIKYYWTTSGKESGIYPDNFWDNGGFGNYWSDYQTKYPNATEIGDTGMADTPYLVGSGYFDNFPLMYPIEQMYHKQTLKINIICDESSNHVGSFPLSFTVDRSTYWLGYSLDGKDNVTITGNTTLTGLAEGDHTLTVYAMGTFGVEGASSPISFVIMAQEDAFVSQPFWMLLVVGVAIGLVAIVACSLLVFYKRKNGAGNNGLA